MRRLARSARSFLPAHLSLNQLRESAIGCTGCDLYKQATQTVFGEGTARASMMLVGEQPGDQEDLAGHPFVGPAGKILDKALGEAGITELRIVQAAASRLARGKVQGKTVLSLWSAVLEYCRAAMAFEDKEQFRILFLDKRNQLISDEVQQTGTVDHTPVYPREVIKRALELSATALILVHNHPSGDPTPSQADIQMTKAIVDIAAPLGISVHDHIIVGKNGHASLKGMRLI